MKNLKKNSESFPFFIWKIIHLGLLFFLVNPILPLRAQKLPSKPPPKRSSSSLPAGFHPPRLKKFVHATFPQKALGSKKHALVILQILLDAKGHVAQVKILKSANKILDKAAIAAVKKFQFIPATLKGKPVPVAIQYRYHFFLKAVKKNNPSPPSSQKQSSKGRRNPTSLPVKKNLSFEKRKKQASKNPSSKNPLKNRRQGKNFFQKEQRKTDSAKKKKVFFRGFVLERGTRRPVDGATIYILGRRFHKQLIANSKGAFELKEKLPIGRFRFVISVPNYAKYEVFLRVFDGKKRSVKWKRPKGKKKRVYPLFLGEENRRDFYLVNLGSGLFESVTRVRREKKEIYRRTIRREELTVIPGTQGDPLKVVQNLPGVARTPLSTGFFVVRGSAPDDSRVYLHGHRIPQLYHFGGLTAVINGDMAKSIDFVPGGFSVAYGRSMGGVIDLKLRRGKERWHGYIDTDQIDIGLFLEGPLWKGATIMMSARRSHLDLFLNLVLPKSRNFDLTVAPRYYDAQLKFDWRLSPTNRTSLIFYLSDDVLSFLRDEPIGRSSLRGNFGFSTTFYRLQGAWIIGKKDKVEHEFSFDIGWTFSKMNGGGKLDVDNKDFVISLRDELRVRFSKSFGIRLGLDSQIGHVDLRLKVPIDIPRPEDPPGSTGHGSKLELSDFYTNHWTVEPAFYLELDWKFLSTLRLLGGVRADYYSESKEGTLDPRVSLIWSPTKRWNITGTVGLFSQPPGGAEISEVFGNPEVRAEHAIHYTLATKWRWNCPLSWDAFCHEVSTGITFYYKQMYSLIVSSNAVIERDGEKKLERLKNGGIGRAYGMEFMLRLPPHRRFFGWISYTLGRSERLDAPDKKWRLFDYDQTHILTIVGALKLGYGFTFSARFRYVSGNPYTPLKGGIFDADSGGYIPIPGELYSERRAAFHQLDLRLDYKIVFPLWMLKFYLDVRNVYNQPNQEGMIYKYDYTKSAPITGVPIVPSLGIKGEF